MGSKKGKLQPLPGNLIPHDRRLGAEGAYHWSLPRPEHRSLGLVADGRGEIRTGTELPPVDLSPLRLPFRHSGAGVRYAPRPLPGHPPPS